MKRRFQVPLLRSLRPQSSTQRGLTTDKHFLTDTWICTDLKLQESPQPYFYPVSVWGFCVYFLFPFSVPEIKPRALCMHGQHCSTDLHSQSMFLSYLKLDRQYKYIFSIFHFSYILYRKSNLNDSLVLFKLLNLPIMYHVSDIYFIFLCYSILLYFVWLSCLKQTLSKRRSI